MNLLSNVASYSDTALYISLCVHACILEVSLLMDHEQIMLATYVPGGAGGGGVASTVPQIKLMAYASVYSPPICSLPALFPDCLARFRFLSSSLHVCMCLNARMGIL